MTTLEANTDYEVKHPKKGTRRFRCIQSGAVQLAAFYNKDDGRLFDHFTVNPRFQKVEVPTLRKLRPRDVNADLIEALAEVVNTLTASNGIEEMVLAKARSALFAADPSFADMCGIPRKVAA